MADPQSDTLPTASLMEPQQAREAMAVLDLEKVQFYPTVRDNDDPGVSMPGTGTVATVLLAFTVDTAQRYAAEFAAGGPPFATVISEKAHSSELMQCATPFRIFIGEGTRLNEIRPDHFIAQASAQGLTWLANKDIAATSPGTTAITYHDGTALKEGDYVTLDGRNGKLYKGELTIDEVPSSVIQWNALALQALPPGFHVYSNASDYLSTYNATMQGQGIGLFRSEALVQDALLATCVNLLPPIVKTPRVSGKPTVLIVEDDLNIQFMLELAIDGEFKDQINAIIVETPKEGLDILAQGEPIGLFITDYTLPGMTGLQLLEQVTASYPDMQCVMTSARPDIETQVRNLGADFIAKPYDLEPILHVISDTLSPEPQFTEQPSHYDYIAPRTYSLQERTDTLRYVLGPAPEEGEERTKFDAARKAFVDRISQRIQSDIVEPYQKANEKRAEAGDEHSTFSVNYRLTDIASLGIHGMDDTASKERFFALQAEAAFTRCESLNPLEPNMANILVPSITSGEELEKIKNAIDEVAERHGFGPSGSGLRPYRFGAMIETIEAASPETAQKIAEICEFASFGTNDLTQAVIDELHKINPKVVPLPRNDLDPAAAREWMEAQSYIEYGESPYDVFIPPVVLKMQGAVNAIRAIRPDFPISCCGRQVSCDSQSTERCIKLDLNGISVPPGDLVASRIRCAHHHAVSQLAEIDITPPLPPGGMPAHTETLAAKGKPAEEEVAKETSAADNEGQVLSSEPKGFSLPNLIPPFLRRGGKTK